MMIGAQLDRIAFEFRTASEGAITALFILKIAGVIDISWWLVFSPFFVGLALSIILVTILILSIKYGKRRNKEDMRNSN